MMKQWILIFALLIFGAVVEAQTNTDERQAVQRARIRKGISSGEVTKPEARRLRTEQRHIRRVEMRANADGTVTRNESTKLRRKQNRASRDIRKQKTD